MEDALAELGRLARHLRGPLQLADAVPDDLVDEIAIACTPDEARDRLALWDKIADEALFYPPSVGVGQRRLNANIETILDLFGNHP